MSDIAEYLASRLRELTPEKWDAFVRSLDQRFRVLEEQLGIERRVTDQILQRGLQVIEDGIGPAILEAEQAAANISAMTDLGLVFFSTSKTSLSVNSNQKTLTIPASHRAQFAPALYLAVFSEGSRENGFVGRRVSYNRATGELVLSVEQTFGSGTFADWELGPIATTEDLEALRDAIVADRAAVQILRNDAVNAAGAASGAAGDANNAKGEAQAALAAFNKIWYGARNTEPAGADVGSQYLDISQTPNVVKVLQEDGWAPTVTVSVGGSRQQVYTATEGQTEFVVDGGFSIGSVNLNGVEMFHGHGVTLDPVAGSFTFGLPLVAGDLVVFRGYLANDLVDIYTKLEANALLAEKAGRADAVRVDGEQSFTPAQKGQARANIGAGILAGFRNKIINGNFDINQRGTAQDFTGYGSADRFALTVGAGAVAEMVSVRAPAATIMGSAGVNSLHLNRTAVGSTPTYIEQNIEDVQTLSGRKVTFTIWMRAPLASAPLPVQMQLFHFFGSGGSPSEIIASETKNVANGNTFVRYDAVFDIPTVFGKTIGVNNRLIARLTMPVGSGVGRVDTARWSLVEGDATMETDPFSPRHIQQELALCQRYFEVAVGGYSGSTAASGSYLGVVRPAVTKRATPTVSWRAGEAVFRFPNSAPAIGVISSSGTIPVTMTASSAGDASYAFHSFNIDAEL